MNEKELAQIIAELKTTNEQALALALTALSKQLDAARLKVDLEEAIKAAKVQGFSPMALVAASRALPAIHVEALRQAKP